MGATPQSSRMSPMASMIRLCLLFTAAAQVAWGSALAARAPNYDMIKFPSGFPNDVKTYYKTDTAVSAFTKSSQAKAKTYAEKGHASYAQLVKPESYEFEKAGVKTKKARSHVVVAITSKKGNVLASTPTSGGSAKSTIETFVRSNAVFKAILNGGTVSSAHAEHHAIYWLIKELGLTEKDFGLASAASTGSSAGSSDQNDKEDTTKDTTKAATKDTTKQGKEPDTKKQKTTEEQEQPPANTELFAAVYGQLPNDFEVNQETGDLTTKPGKGPGFRSPCGFFSQNDQANCEDMLRKSGIKWST